MCVCVCVCLFVCLFMHGVCLQHVYMCMCVCGCVFVLYVFSCILSCHETALIEGHDLQASSRDGKSYPCSVPPCCLRSWHDNIHEIGDEDGLQEERLECKITPCMRLVEKDD